MSVIALAGNQNSGKTTLYNKLTGSNQHVGNFPGVTLEKKEGQLKKHKDISIVDLPGIYSLSPYTLEEVVTRDFLLKEKPDLILNIVDATNIERNLYLTLQLMELSIPMVIALNMMDEVTASGNSIDVKKLSSHLGIPVVPISASRGEGISELIDVIIRASKDNLCPKKLDFCIGEVHKAIHSISHLIYDQAVAAGYPPRFAATKLVEGDEPTFKSLAITENQIHIIEHVVKDMEEALKTDREAALADMRYCYIEKICSEAVVKRQETKEQRRSEKIDRVLTHKYFGIPIFLGIMFFIFYCIFIKLFRCVTQYQDVLIFYFFSQFKSFTYHCHRKHIHTIFKIHLGHFQRSHSIAVSFNNSTYFYLGTYCPSHFQKIMHSFFSVHFNPCRPKFFVHLFEPPLVVWRYASN
jgi:ferrous iron transport protein B